MALFRQITKMAAVLVLAGAALAQDSDEPRIIDFDGITWTSSAREATLERHRGRSALRVLGGRLLAEEADFTDGVISFDVAFDEGALFAGVGWRQDRPGHSEYWYLRGHLSGKPDSMQYTPVENGLSAWQIFSDGNAQAVGHHDFSGWNRVKIVVVGDQADIYYNTDEPLLHVPDLKTDAARGQIWLNVFGPDDIPVYFSNFKVRGLEAGDRITGTPEEGRPLPDGLVTAWQVSSPISEDKVKGQLEVSDGFLDGLVFQRIDVETNGIANLAKLANRADGDTVIIRRTINSADGGMRKLSFGYSDRVRIYLNGKRVFSGNAGWRVQDYRFLGTVGFYDSVGLDLEPGQNDLVVAVSETFGGWAWAGAFSD